MKKSKVTYSYDSEEYNLLIDTIATAKEVIQKMKERPEKYEQFGITRLEDDLTFWEKELEFFENKIKEGR